MAEQLPALAGTTLRLVPYAEWQISNGSGVMRWQAHGNAECRMASVEFNLSLTAGERIERKKAVELLTSFGPVLFVLFRGSIMGWKA